MACCLLSPALPGLSQLYSGPTTSRTARVMWSRGRWCRGGPAECPSPSARHGLPHGFSSGCCCPSDGTCFACLTYLAAWAKQVRIPHMQVRSFPCDCAYPACCDSQEGCIPPTRAMLRTSGGSSSGAGSSESSVGSRWQDAGGCSGGGAWLVPEGVLAAATDDSTLQQAVSQEQGPQPNGDGSSSQVDGGGGGSSAVEEVERELQQLEQRYVHSVYNAIAPHFSSTRYAPLQRRDPVSSGLMQRAG